MDTVIKLKHADVADKLNQISRILDQVMLPVPSAESLGENELRLTKEWIQREKEIHSMIEEYKVAVKKNLEDTMKNIDHLRERDESIAYVPAGPYK